jgi:hypothetical protein
MEIVFLAANCSGTHSVIKGPELQGEFYFLHSVDLPTIVYLGILYVFLS